MNELFLRVLKYNYVWVLPIIYYPWCSTIPSQ